MNRRTIWIFFTFITAALVTATCTLTPQQAAPTPGAAAEGATPTANAESAGEVQPTPTSTPQPTPTAVPTQAPDPGYTGYPEAFAPLEGIELALSTNPRRPVRIYPSVFDGKMIIGLYGAPSGPGLGILGTASATQTVIMAQLQANAYQALLTDTLVIPYFHMVTTVADPSPGADGDYNHRVTTGTIQTWVNVAKAYGLLSVLDVQPGHSPITTELSFAEQFVRQPGVHLAVDPEFLMKEDGDVPGAIIGHLTGALLNLIQDWLERVAVAAGERKVLIIHQFDDRMISGKEEIRHFPNVDLVWDADGFGGPGAKMDDYLKYAGEPGYEFGGFKLFYNYDSPLMTPEQVLGLNPRPVMVVYQ